MSMFLLGVALGVGGVLLLYVYHVKVRSSAWKWAGNIHEVEDHAVDEFEEALRERGK